MRLGKQRPSCLWEGAGPGLRQAGWQRWGRAPPVPAKLRAPDGRGLTGGAGSGSGPCLVAFSTGIVAAAQSRARQAEAAAREASGGPSPPPRPGVFPGAGLRTQGSRPLLRAPPCGREGTGQPLALPPCRPPACLAPAPPASISVWDTVTAGFWLHWVVLHRGWVSRCHGVWLSFLLCRPGWS